MEEEEGTGRDSGNINQDDPNTTTLDRCYRCKAYKNNWLRPSLEESMFLLLQRVSGQSSIYPIIVWVLAAIPFGVWFILLIAVNSYESFEWILILITFPFAFVFVLQMVVLALDFHGEALTRRFQVGGGLEHRLRYVDEAVVTDEHRPLL